MSQDTKGQNLIIFNGQGQKGRGGNLTFDISAGKDGEGPHIQCFVLGGHPVQQAKGRADGSSTVFGINTEEQVLQIQAEYSFGDALGSE